MQWRKKSRLWHRGFGGGDLLYQLIYKMELKFS